MASTTIAWTADRNRLARAQDAPDRWRASARPRRVPGRSTFVSALTRRRIRRGSFHSIVDLPAAINRYIAEHNADPKPFTWTKTPERILAKLNPLNASVHQKF